MPEAASRLRGDEQIRPGSGWWCRQPPRARTCARPRRPTGSASRPSPVENSGRSSSSGPRGVRGGANGGRARPRQPAGQLHSCAACAPTPGSARSPHSLPATMSSGSPWSTRRTASCWRVAVTRRSRPAPHRSLDTAPAFDETSGMLQRPPCGRGRRGSAGETCAGGATTDAVGVSGADQPRIAGRGPLRPGRPFPTRLPPERRSPLPRRPAAAPPRGRAADGRVPVPPTG